MQIRQSKPGLLAIGATLALAVAVGPTLFREAALAAEGSRPVSAEPRAAFSNLAPDSAPQPDAATSSADSASQVPRLEVLAHDPLGGRGLNADIWLHHGFAYVGTWAAGSDRLRGCPGTGVKVVDLSNPAQPELVGTVAEHEGTSAEVVRVRRVETPSFRGDLLAVGLQACSGEALRGVDLWDVTDPLSPQPLGFASVGPGTGGVHELDLVQRPDGRVLALLAVPFSEASNPDHLGDFRIVEVTDPRAPVPLADWGARAALNLGQYDGQGNDTLIYAHSAHASPDGMRAYVSYWDAGVMVFDLADPATPRLLGRTGFPPDAEGNAHSVDVSSDGRLMIEGDEILDVESHALRVDSPPAVAGLVPAGGTLPAPPWSDTPSVMAPVAYLGRGCPAGDWVGRVAGGGRVDAADPYPADPSGRIALLDRGTCPFADKVERAQTAGAVGAIVINSVDTPLTPNSADGPIGAFGIAHAAGERLKAQLAAGQAVAVTLSEELRGYGDFGGLRFWDLADPAQPRALATFATPRSRVDRVQGPSESGRYSAHNPVIQGNLLFVSWFSDGVRVLDTSDPSAPREVASWVPPPGTAPEAIRNYLGDGAQVWGVAVDGDLVVASDINSGLWVLRLSR
jgi:hypothetical protein